MLQSFLVYGSLTFFLYALGQISSRRQKLCTHLKKCTPFWIWDVFFALLFFSVISGIRWNVGKDHQSYLANYLNYQKNGSFIIKMEDGFNLITSFFAESGFHFSFYFGFIAFIQILFIYLAFKKESYLYPFLGFVIILGPFFLGWMNGMRQMMVATAFIWAIPFILKRQWLRYCIFIFLASFIHKSVILLLPLYFLPNRDFFKNNKLTYVLVLFSLILGNTTVWVGLLNNLSGLLESIGYFGYGENLSIFTEEEVSRNIGPRRIVMILAPLLTIYFSRDLKKRFSNTYFLTYYNISIIGFLLYNVFANTHHIFIRPILYFTVFSIATSAYLLYFLRERIKRKTTLFIITFLIMMAYLPLSIIAEAGKGKEDYANYKFFWNHVTE